MLIVLIRSRLAAEVASCTWLADPVVAAMIRKPPHILRPQKRKRFELEAGELPLKGGSSSRSRP